MTEQTYYRWQEECCSFMINQAKRLKELERENTRLKRPIADLGFDKSMLKEVARGNFMRRAVDPLRNVSRLREVCMPSSGADTLRQFAVPLSPVSKSGLITQK